jgi:hypothetical protein
MAVESLRVERLVATNQACSFSVDRKASRRIKSRTAMTSCTVLRTALGISLLVMCTPMAKAQESFGGCPPAGDAKREPERALNRQKNRYVRPRFEQIDRRAKLEALLQPGVDQDRWLADRGAEIVGYVAMIHTGGRESCNCHVKAQDRRDTHIHLVLSPSDAPNNRRHFVVVITPRTRTIAARHGAKWDTETLQHTIIGKWVKVRGWLLFNTDKVKSTENSHPGNRYGERATAWEIHPVTNLQIVDNPAESAKNPLKAVEGIFTTVAEILSIPFQAIGESLKSGPSDEGAKTPIQTPSPNERSTSTLEGEHEHN